MGRVNTATTSPRPETLLENPQNNDLGGGQLSKGVVVHRGFWGPRNFFATLRNFQGYQPLHTEWFSQRADFSEPELHFKCTFTNLNFHGSFYELRIF